MTRHVLIMTNTDEAIKLRKNTKESETRENEPADPVPVLVEPEVLNGSQA